jgi:hypothetical protein
VKARHEIQQHATDLIAAHPYFSGHSVLVDLGLVKADMAAALKTKGFALCVFPLLGGVLLDSGTGKGVQNVRVVVHWEINPTVNAVQATPEVEDPPTPEGAPGSASLDIYKILSAVESALLAYAPVNPNDRYKCSQGAFNFLENDAGLLSYNQHFEKLCVTKSPI